MNAKTSKLIGKIARITGAPKRDLKRKWNRTPKRSRGGVRIGFQKTVEAYL
jgi:hypothetical protein